MRLRIGRPRAALIVAPHADDEAIGALGLIVSLRRRGVRVGVIVVSDGAASHPTSLRWPRARLVAARRRESRRAMRRLGLAAPAVRFLDLPDGALAGLPPRRFAALDRSVGRLGRHDLLIGPAADDGHPDHRAVAAALRRARCPARRLSYPVWPPGRTARRSARRCPIPVTIAAKRSVLRGYATQAGLIRDDPAGFAMAPHEIRAFGGPIEFFYEERR